MNRILWVVQSLLAFIFLAAGAMKFATPVANMADKVHLSAGFLHFIAAAEILGAIGLILPCMLNIQRWLTPLAAALLAIIMIGAAYVSASYGPMVSATFPAVTGLLCVFVAWGRWGEISFPLARQ